jgi:hypothetical protein
VDAGLSSGIGRGSLIELRYFFGDDARAEGACHRETLL